MFTVHFRTGGNQLLHVFVPCPNSKNILCVAKVHYGLDRFRWLDHFFQTGVSIARTETFAAHQFVVHPSGVAHRWWLLSIRSSWVSAWQIKVMRANHWERLHQSTRPSCSVTNAIADGGEHDRIRSIIILFSKYAKKSMHYSNCGSM